MADLGEGQLSKRNDFEFATKSKALLAAGLSEFSETGQLMVLDAVLEHELAPFFYNELGVSDFALFGYCDALVVIVATKIDVRPVELTFSFRVKSLTWEDGQRSLELAIARPSVNYRSRLSHTTSLGLEGLAGAGVASAFEEGIDAASDIGLDFIPFARIGGKIISTVFERVALTFKMENVSNVLDTTTTGISLKDGTITIDLEQFPPTASILSWKPNSLGGFKAAFIPPLGQLIEIQKLEFGREGVRLGMSLDPQLRTTLAVGRMGLGAISGTLQKWRSKS